MLTDGGIISSCFHSQILTCVLNYFLFPRNTERDRSMELIHKYNIYSTSFSCPYIFHWPAWQLSKYLRSKYLLPCSALLSFVPRDNSAPPAWYFFSARLISPHVLPAGRKLLSCFPMCHPLLSSARTSSLVRRTDPYMNTRT